MLELYETNTGIRDIRVLDLDNHRLTQYRAAAAELI